MKNSILTASVIALASHTVFPIRSWDTIHGRSEPVRKLPKRIIGDVTLNQLGNTYQKKQRKQKRKRKGGE